VVIHDFDVVGVTTSPSEADPPLVVDPDAVLALPITPQQLQPVARWDPQVVQPVSSVQHPELPQGHSLYVNPEASGRVSREQPLGVPIAEALDHGL
jgi:hypothetical protein